MAEYLSCAETAKLLRGALKEALPDVQFSVRSHTYSGGASIRVRWTDGPNQAQVDSIAKHYAGATFDGMIDLKEYHETMHEGRSVHFGADFVFTEHEHSDGAIQRAIDHVISFWGQRPWLSAPTVENYHRGLLWGCVPSGIDYFDFGREINTWLSKISDRFCIEKLAT